MGAKLARKKFVAAVIETEKGVPEEVTAADAAILAFDPEINQGIQFADRKPAGIASGNLPGVPGPYEATAKIKVELRGAGGDGQTVSLPVWAGTLLAASAMKATGSVLTPVTSIVDQQTITLVVWEDGLRKSICGAMCDATIEGDPGERIMVSFDVKGIWVGPVDESAPTGITHEPSRPIRMAGVTLTLGGASSTRISKFTFKTGNDLQMRPDTGKTSAIAHYYMADRDPTLGIDPEAVSVSDNDVFGDWMAGVTKALDFSAGSVAGNTWGITAPAFQYLDPQEASRNGLLTHEFNGKLTTENGEDDHFEITAS